MSERGEVYIFRKVFSIAIQKFLNQSDWFNEEKLLQHKLKTSCHVSAVNVSPSSSFGGIAPDLVWRTFQFRGIK